MMVMLRRGFSGGKRSRRWDDACVCVRKGDKLWVERCLVGDGKFGRLSRGNSVITCWYM